VKLCVPTQRDKPLTPGAQRSAIEDFSHAARKRLLTLLQMVDRDTPLPLFVTLTYPMTWPDDPAEWKRHLDNFSKWMGRHYPSSSAVWKLEPQKRGAPHFHLLVWGAGFIPHRDVAEAWYKIVGSGDPNHLAAGTEVRRVETRNGVAYYAGKYLAKTDTPFQGVGRFWGIHRRSNLPITPPDKETVTMSEAVQMVRWARRALKAKGVRRTWRGSVTLFTEAPGQWAVLLHRLRAGKVGKKAGCAVMDRKISQKTC
jgi:hypothetical protein